MELLRQIRAVPPNLADFVSESAEGIGELFGGRASGDYRNQPSTQLEASLALSEIEAFAVFDGNEAVGLSISAVISFPMLPRGNAYGTVRIGQ